MKIQIMGENDFLFNPREQIAKNRGLKSLKDLNVTIEDVNNPNLFKNIEEGV